MMTEHAICMACQQGPRTSIEDNAFSIRLDHPFNTDEPVLAFGVLDGVGGHAGGHIASSIGTTSISSSLTTQCISRYASSANEHPASLGISEPPEDDPSWFTEEYLLHALEMANEEIVSVAQTHAWLSQMATTAVCGVLASSRAILGWAGDSRAYLLHHDQIRQLTRDHSQIQLLIDEGLLSPAEADHHPDQHVITSYLGCRDGFTAESITCTVETGDTLLLCTDGVHDVLDQQALAQLLGETDDQGFPDLADVIVERAIEAGTTDNATALCIRVCGHPRQTHHPTRTLVGDYAALLAEMAHRHQLKEITTCNHNTKSLAVTAAS